MAGNTDMYFGSLTTVMTYIQSGRLKLIAVGGQERNPQVPVVRTVSETVPGYESYIWWGIFAPKGTPEAMMDRLHDVTNEALRSPELLKKLDVQGAMPRPMSRAKFAEFMQAETRKWTEVIKAAGIVQQ
jgi:tripartite-type tricarboxylate transporter receptor subunit TctC